MSRVERMFADSKYHNYALYEWVEEQRRAGSWSSCVAPRVRRAG